MKDKLILDVAALADSDNVGAYLRDANGNLLTSTLIAGKQSLDINVVQSALPAGAATEATLASRASEATLATRASEATVAAILADTADIEIATEASATSLAQFQFTGGRLLVDQITSVPNTAIKSSNAAVTSTSAALIAVPLASRKRVLIENLGQKTVYIGASGVSISNGYKVSPGSAVDLELGSAIIVHGVTETGTADVRLLEVA